MVYDPTPPILRKLHDSLLQNRLKRQQQYHHDEAIRLRQQAQKLQVQGDVKHARKLSQQAVQHEKNEEEIDKKLNTIHVVY